MQLGILRQSLRRMKILPSVWEAIEVNILHALGIGPAFHFTFFNDSTGHYLEKACREQCHIGWTNMIKGRISRYWGKAQQVLYSQQFPDVDALSACTFQLSLIRGMWRLFDGVWWQRNAMLHDKETGAMHAEYDKQIREMFRRRLTLVADHDLPLFEVLQQDDLLKLSTATKKQWIEHIHIAIKSKHGNLKPLQAPLPNIERYFERRTRQNATVTRTENAQEG